MLGEALHGATSDAGSIPAASIGLVEPSMVRDNGYIPRIIESAESRVRSPSRRRFDFSPRQALYYNDHPDTIIEDPRTTRVRVIEAELAPASWHRPGFAARDGAS